ncbi:unnamed protein product [Didymodactylos carnosus]|uniref:Uncharacterized protein n=1 Tax=Didymodactylos carnosus TaxID=1234261 RepID=A0A814DPW2_9BILA|nr:unnamed protein product [Didymodactylos carnosus]CAF1640298.1 unnamed protein product [Didymodactylos carnosus]CAF3733421.1 unnamed protein product [Didymodactylos carnosus]CAF4476088.1 unnamed protein product [Didymodactylos carnosus]
MACPGQLDQYGIWNNGFDCLPINGRPRICCQSESKKECCFVDQQRSDVNDIDSDAVRSDRILLLSSSTLSSISHKTDSSYNLVMIGIGITVCLLVICLVIIIYLLKRKCTSLHSRDSRQNSDESRFSGSSKCSDNYSDYWNKTNIPPTEWTLTKLCNENIGPTSYNFYSDN